MTDCADSPCRLLVVEDSEDLALVWKILFQEAGYEARFCATGQAAMALADAGYAPDVLITDYYLPDRTGLEVIHHIRARDPQVHVLMVTGHSDDGFLQRLDSEGVEVLCKPVRFDDLRARIAAMRQRRAEGTGP
ncbi:MAG TPA: response regulator [Alphaproteobacteria bacterium]|nr:response regulator [Alphaproteobacteria bacterium]